MKNPILQLQKLWIHSQAKGRKITFEPSIPLYILVTHSLTTILTRRQEYVLQVEGMKRWVGGGSWCLMGTLGEDEKALEKDGDDGYTTM